MDVGDVFELKVAQNLPNIGDEALNVFFYRLDTGIFELDDFIGAFVLEVALEMRSIQSDDLSYTSFTLTNLFDLDEFFVRTYDVGELAGLLSNPSAPPSTALNFTLRRSSRTVRNGSKRIAGIPNVDIVNGVITSPGYATAMGELAEAFAAPIEEAVSGAVLTPVIVKRIKTPNPDYPDDSKYPFKYTLPTAAGMTPIVPINGCTFSLFASTQVSRKTNR